MAQDKHFSGSEASNVLYISPSINWSERKYVRSSLMRAVEQLFVIELIGGLSYDQLNGFKEDNTFIT